MKIFRVLLVMTLGILIIFVVGCDRETTMVKPLIESTNEAPDTRIALSETDAREKARQVVERAFQTALTALITAQAPGEDFDAENYFEELRRIYTEETGIDLDFATGTLLPIHREENPEEASISDYSVDNLIEEYLFLSFRYPGESQEALLGLFRESARSGNTTVSAEKVEARYADFHL